MRVGKRLVFVNPTVIPTMCFKVRRLERGWFSQNQPSFQPWTLRYESLNRVAFRKTNRHSNHGLQYTKVGTWLVSAKPTVIPTMGYDIRKLERRWFLHNQPPFQPSASISEGWNAVGFRKTNRHSNRGLQDTKVGSELVFVKPTVIPTFGLNIRGLEPGWFSQIQLSIKPLPLMYEGWKTVGFRQSNRHSNHVL